MTESTLRLTSLIADPAVWPRRFWDEERVALFADLYAADGPNALPPIIVVPRSDKYIVADGWTRARAATLIRLAALPAKVIPLPDGADPTEFVYRLALETASASARPLTRAERHAAVVRLLAATPPLSDREIAKLAGVAHPTVGRIRKKEKVTGGSEPGEDYLASTTATDLAVRFFRSMEKLEDSRGLTDLVLGDRTGERLASVLRDVFGDQAPERARRYRTWVDAAIARLGASA